MTSFDLKQLLPFYADVGILRYGGTLNFHSLEKIMEPVHLGQEEFSIRHLEIIQKDHLFPAWWKLPELSPAEIDSIKWAFKNLRPKDEAIIQKLFEIFKNIEVMSCLLRVIGPKHYGLYSAPVENLLSIKAETPVKKYLFYLDNLTELQEIYGFDRIADVDMALWTLAALLNEEYLWKKPEYHQIITAYLNQPNPVKKISARNALRDIRKANPIYLDLAECFLDTDPEIAGIMAGKELECLINKLLLENQSTYKYYPPSKMPEKLDELARKKVINDQVKEDILSWWETRNNAVHWDLAQADDWKLKDLKEKVCQMISGIRKIKEKP